METHDQIFCEHYGRMLGLTEGWKVSGVDLRLEDKRLELRLGWERSGAICPECGVFQKLYFMRSAKIQIQREVQSRSSQFKRPCFRSLIKNSDGSRMGSP